MSGGAPAAPGPARPSDGDGFRLFLAVAVVAAGALAATLAIRPSAPRGEGAPATEFSAARAERHLQDLVGDGRPRPLGSEENAAGRDRVVAAFRELGLATEVERVWHVVPSAGGAWVSNVVARLPGTVGGPPVAVVTHHDSVGAGPGVADDLMSVAASIEVARALRAGPGLSRDVVFLTTDGEEAGLLGARAHVRGLAEPYAAVVNLEARGNTGPSLLFETGPGNASAVAAWARHAPHPVTSSLFAAVYRELPNDTDFSVFLGERTPGLNFACIGRVQHYHTPYDALPHLDRRTLQHQGDNALAAVRGLATMDDPAGDGSDAVWFDVLGLGVVRWGTAATLPLAVGAFVLCVAAAVVGVRSGAVRLRHVLRAIEIQGVAGALGGAGGWLAWQALEGLGALPRPFVAAPGFAVAAIACAALAGAWTAPVVAAVGTSPVAAALATWGIWAASGVAAAQILPEGAYLLVVPAFVAGASGLVAARTRSPLPYLAPLAAAVVLWSPPWLLLADAVGIEMAPLGFPVAFVATAAGPFLAVPTLRRTAAVLAPLVVAIGALAGAAFAPTETPEVPRRVTFIRVVDAEDPHSRVFVQADGPVPAALRGAFPFEDTWERVVPWSNARLPAFEAGPVAVEPPELAGLRSVPVDGGRRLRFRLTSRRGAARTLLAIEPSARVRRVVVGGIPVPAESLRRPDSGAYVVRCLTTPADGIDVEIDLVGGEPADAFVSDATWGLPASDARILELRGADAVPSGEGDGTVVVRRLRL